MSDPSSDARPSPAYRPVDCSLHDRFEAAAVQRTRVRIAWESATGEEFTTKSTIRDIGARDGAEYLTTADGSEIRLDRIRSFEPVREG